MAEREADVAASYDTLRKFGNEHQLAALTTLLDADSDYSEWYPDLLRVATIYGAEAIGMDKDIGSLEAGKLADIVVLDANPLENIRNTNTVRYVMKNGRLYEGDTLNEIYPRQRSLPKQFWMGAGVVHTEAGIR